MNSRYDYDEMYESHRVLHEIDEHTRIVHITFAARNCSSTRRNFCMVWHTAQLPGGVGLTFAKSVIDSSCPPTAAYARGEMHIAGCLLRPVGDGKHTEMTHLVHASLGGHIRSWLIQCHVRRRCDVECVQHRLQTSAIDLLYHYKSDVPSFCYVAT